MAYFYERLENTGLKAQLKGSGDRILMMGSPYVSRQGNQHGAARRRDDRGCWLFCIRQTHSDPD